jgi:putative resolvase
MKLGEYARKVGVTYRTAFQWWKDGRLKGYQMPTGTIIITEEPEGASSRSAPPLSAPQVVIYARVSSGKQREDLERQVQRLLDYCAAKGYQVTRTVKEIASGLNDSRPKFLALLKDRSIGTLVVEHKDRATRFGFRYLETLLEAQNRRIEVVNFAESNREDVLVDLTSVIYSLCARLYGQRRAKRKAETIMKQVEETCDSSSNT